jgi:hypothetical protein
VAIAATRCWKSVLPCATFGGSRVTALIWIKRFPAVRREREEERR